MAFIVKIPNGSGDGAGRSRYLLKKPEKVLSVSSNIPSPALICGDYRRLADDFNMTLLNRQGDYRTDHFVVSFQHRFSEDKVEDILRVIEGEFQREFGEDRSFLIVVHAEDFQNKTPDELLDERLGNPAVPRPIQGTSFHIAMGRNTKGRGIRLSKREYMDFKRRMSEKLQAYDNEREREVFKHFLEGRRTRDYYKKGELYSPESNEKVWSKRILREITQKLEEGKVSEAVKILDTCNAGIDTFDVSPYNKKILKEPTPYMVFPRLNSDGTFAIRLRKAERALFERYRNAFERLRNESERFRERVKQEREAIECNVTGVEELKSGIKELEREEAEIAGRIKRVGEERGNSKRPARQYSHPSKEVRHLPKEGHNPRSGKEVENTERQGRKPMLPARSRQLSDILRDKREMETLQQPLRAVYSIGVVKDGGINRAVITDNKEVLRKLGAKSIEKIETAERFVKYWKTYRCRGCIDAYVEGTIPGWLEEGKNQAVWHYTRRASWPTSVETTDEVKPVKVERKEYFKTKDGMVLEDEVKKAPKPYLNSENKRLKKLAEEEFERQKRLREEREQDKYGGPGM